MVGRRNAGKRSLSLRIFGHHFTNCDEKNLLVDNKTPYEITEYTVSCDFSPDYFSNRLINKTPRTTNILIDDKSFPREFQRVDDLLDQSIKTALYCVELTETFDEAIIRQDIAKFRDEYPGVPLVLVGTKSDLSTPELNHRFDALSQEIAFDFSIKTSAKNDEIDEPFIMEELSKREPSKHEAIPFIFGQYPIDGVQVLLKHYLNPLCFKHDFEDCPPSLWKKASDEFKRVLVSEHVPADAIAQIKEAKTRLATMISEGPEDRATAIAAFNDTCNAILKDQSPVAKRAVQVFVSAVVVALIFATISVAIGSYLAFCAGMGVSGFISGILAGNVLGKGIALGSGAAGFLAIGFGIFEPSKEARALLKFTKSVENIPLSEYEKSLIKEPTSAPSSNA